VRLSDRIGDKLGYFGVSPVPPQLRDQPVLTSCGYPGSLDNGLDMYCHRGVSMVSYKAQCQDDDGKGGGQLGNIRERPGLHADAQLAGGQSGSGLWFEERGETQEHGEGQADQYIIGVASVIYGAVVDVGQEAKPMAIYAGGLAMVNSVIRERERVLA